MTVFSIWDGTGLGAMGTSGICEQDNIITLGRRLTLTES